MPTLSFLFYLLAVGAAWLLREIYLGWFAPYFFWCVVILPPALSLLSLPAMLSVRTNNAVRATVRKGQRDYFRLTFSVPPLLPPCRVLIRTEIENCYTGEAFRGKYSCITLQGEEIEVPLPTGLCGQLRCRVTKLECRDILGLFRLPRKVPEEQVCTVLPLPREPEKLPDLDAALDTAAVLRPKYGGGYSEEHELREYCPGDPGNAIHWKLSSKTDTLIVREALERENDRIYVVLGRVGAEDRGLETLYWLSGELCRRELPHQIIADRMYTVGNEQETVEALCSLLAYPLGEVLRFDASGARCVLRVVDGEVQLW
jgi:uncharacterized protein (DUF58 family)